MDMAMTIIMVVVMIGVFWLLLIRPEKKKKKQKQEMLEALSVGDEITTIGGVCGTICHVKENSIVIETGADRVRIELMKWAIGSIGAQTEEAK